MTTKEFRSNPDFVAELREIFEKPVMKLWLEALDTDENPLNRSAPLGIQAHEAMIMLGEQTGWRAFQNRFLLGGVHLPVQKDDGPQDYSMSREEIEKQEKLNA